MRVQGKVKPPETGKTSQEGGRKRWEEGISSREWLKYLKKIKEKQRKRRNSRTDRVRVENTLRVKKGFGKIPP